MIDFNSSRRHRRADKKAFYSMIMMIIGVLVLILIIWHGIKNSLAEATDAQLVHVKYTPESNAGTIYHKPSFSLSYVEQYELPEWVTYELTVDMLNHPKSERNQSFSPDPDIASGSGHYRDYKSSGYRRGHLVPSADMAWNKEAMDATFLLSNVAPMRQEFNDGIWLELEHNIRDWSRRYKKITVVTGPIFRDPVATIGENEILVPRYFYKAAFTLHNGKPLVIGFLFDQTRSAYGNLEDYVVPIDSIEEISGLDLFANLYGDWDEEIRLEKRDKKPEREWPMNEKWKEKRKNQ